MNKLGVRYLGQRDLMWQCMRETDGTGNDQRVGKGKALSQDGVGRVRCEGGAHSSPSSCWVPARKPLSYMMNDE